MKHLFTILIVTSFSTLLHSQLSITNNHYVFNNDEVLFIEDDLNLNNSNSILYLRSEGQLIQGSGTTGNTGIGELSIYQEGNVGAHEYNYWCSPIGSKTNNSINNPFGVTLLNDVVSLTTSTPATIAHVSDYNSTSSPLVIEPFWIWKFITSSQYSDWIHVRGTTTVNPGEGFTMKGTVGSGDAQQYDFRGKPNNGTIDVSVLNGEFTLVGNPYPSAMDALSYIHDTDNSSVITGTLYFWEQDPSVNSHYITAYDGGYATYTIDALGVETYTPATFSMYDSNGAINGMGYGSPSGKRPRRYIPVGQGFMVEGTATGTVKTKNTHRVFEKETSTNSEFFKASNKKNATTASNTLFSIVPEHYKRFRLNIDFSETYTRQLVETFNPLATLGFDYGMESKINSKDILASDAFLSNNNSSYIAEALVFDQSIKIPLTIKVERNMPIGIRIADIQNFDTNQPIYLHDKEANLYFDLRQNDYSTTLETGNYTDRFEITFVSKTLSIDDVLDTKSIYVLQNKTTSDIEIYNPALFNLNSFRLYDNNGKLLLNSVLSGSNKKHIINAPIFSEGVYIIQISSENNRLINRKLKITNN